jgi:hypothetical protein
VRNLKKRTAPGASVSVVEAVNRKTGRKIKIVLIHGFNVRDNGAGSIDQLEPHLRDLFGHENVIIDKDSADYGWDFLLKVHFFYVFGDTIQRIAMALSDADVAITHSNGANYCMKALRKINNYWIHLIHISPALNKKWKFRETFRRCDVIYSRNDRIVYLAKFIPFSPWGNMGQVGPKTDDPRVFGQDLTRVADDHSDWFKPVKSRSTAMRIHKLVSENI